MWFKNYQEQQVALTNQNIHTKKRYRNNKHVDETYINNDYNWNDAKEIDDSFDDDWETNQFNWDDLSDSDNAKETNVSFEDDDSPKESFIDYLSSDDDKWDDGIMLNNKDIIDLDDDPSNFVDEIL